MNEQQINTCGNDNNDLYLSRVLNMAFNEEIIKFSEVC